MSKKILNLGWVCAKCQRSYSPFVQECHACVPKYDSSVISDRKEYQDDSENVEGMQAKFIGFRPLSRAYSPKGNGKIPDKVPDIKWGTSK